MTDVVMITNEIYIKSEPGVSEKNILTAYRTLRSMESVMLFAGSKGTYVEVRFSGGSHWTLDVSSTRGYSVTLNGAVPLDNETLASSLATLLV